MAAKGHKKIKWRKDDEFIEFVKLLLPHLSYADIGRLLGRNRRTIHRLVKDYNLESYKNAPKNIPLIIIKSKKYYENDMLSLQDLKK